MLWAFVLSVVVKSVNYRYVASNASGAIEERKLRLTYHSVTLLGFRLMLSWGPICDDEKGVVLLRHTSEEDGLNAQLNAHSYR